MRQGRVIDLTGEIAILSAKISLELRLPMAGSIILATARLHETVLWTQDADFQGLEGVNFISRVH